MSWLIGFVISLAFHPRTNLPEQKAIKELNQLWNCDWLTSQFTYVTVVSLSHLHPSHPRCDVCVLHAIYSIQTSFFSFLQLHFPALIASSSCVWKIQCWFNLHHAIMQAHTRISSIIRNWRDLTPHFAYVHARATRGHRSKKCRFLTFILKWKFLINCRSSSNVKILDFPNQNGCFASITLSLGKEA